MGRDEGRRAGTASPRGKTLLGGVPRTLPGLLRAYEYGSRAAAVGFDWVRAADVIDKIEEEVRELRDELSKSAQADEAERAGRVEEEMGDLLFAIANLSRKLGVEPEAALRRANDKFQARFTALESRVVSRGERLQDKTLEELENEWQLVKRLGLDHRSMESIGPCGPSGCPRPFLTADWRYLVMLNFDIAPEALLPFLPAAPPSISGTAARSSASSASGSCARASAASRRCCCTSSSRK